MTFTEKHMNYIRNTFFMFFDCAFPVLYYKTLILLSLSSSFALAINLNILLHTIGENICRDPKFPDFSNFQVQIYGIFS